MNFSRLLFLNFPILGGGWKYLPCSKLWKKIGSPVFFFYIMGNTFTPLKKLLHKNGIKCNCNGGLDFAVHMLSRRKYLTEIEASQKGF